MAADAPESGSTVRPGGGAATQPTDAVEPGQTIGGRYVVAERLGEGGTAAVYCARDLVTSNMVALKRLARCDHPNRRRQAEELFEQEFHTLAQLSHPRVIAVYDYGRDENGPYYTMELLDGGDLREHSPLPWRKACALLFDVCSSLALLHSRRLVHRDVTPRNIRCTRDGAAKLIDFGAMTAMGSGKPIVGTPAFLAPEVLHRGNLDARTDLFSLGGTLYYALTRKLAYRAREIRILPEVWARRPLPPSSFAADVPPALDALVLALLSIDPAARPRTAYEVMQRLSAVAALHGDEPWSVQQAYLSTPSMVGRDEIMGALRGHLERMMSARGGAVAVLGSPGLGRTRMIDAAILEAKTLGAWALRAGAEAAEGEPLAVARQLADQLLESDPQSALSCAQAEGVAELLFPPEAASTDARARADSAAPQPRAELQDALRRFFSAVARKRPLLIAVDDAERIDDASAALLAMLVDGAQQAPLLVLVTIDAESERRGSGALGALESRCAPLMLEPLTRAQTAELLSSVFGEVPNLAVIADWVHGMARGNPRASMDLAQHLTDKQYVVYRGGSWSLPADLSSVALPSSTDDALRERIARLSPLARKLAQAQALALNETMSREQHLQIAAPDANAGRVDHALGELVAHRILVREGALYALAHRGWAAALRSTLLEGELEERHAALGRVYERDGSRAGLAAVHHLLLGGLPERALDLLVAIAQRAEQQRLTDLSGLGSVQLATLIDQAITAAIKLRRPPRELAVLRYRQVLLSILAGPVFFYRAAPAFREQLERDSGLSHFRELAAVEDRGERLRAAIARAAERYAATPEAERVYRPDEAIRLLVYYAAGAMTAGSNAIDARLLGSVPELLEPFAELSPLIAVMLRNATSLVDTLCCRYEQALARWHETFALLSEPHVVALPFAEHLRYAAAYAVGSLEARLGLGTAARWAEILDEEPIQRVNAVYLRRVIRLQQGDADGAERLRQQAELLELQTPTSQLSSSLLVLELAAAAFTGDVTSVRRIADRIRGHAAVHRGWVPFARLAEGQFQQLCGDYTAARYTLQECMAMARPDPDAPLRSIGAWPPATAAYVETLIALGEHDTARASALEELALCERVGLGMAAHEIERAAALAEARCGDLSGAALRLEALLERQLQLGVCGLHLGATYEARTRVAIWAGDAAAVERFGALTAEEYRHGTGSALGARYERLVYEARSAGLELLPKLVSLQPAPADARSPHLSEAQSTATTRSLDATETAVPPASAHREPEEDRGGAGGER